MKEDLLKIINTYGVLPQLEYYQTEVWELNDAIRDYESSGWDFSDEECIEIEKEYKEHITEEIADNFVMLHQFPEYYYERLDVHNIEPYIFRTDNYEHIEEISKYLKKFQKDVCKLTCVIATAEEREQDYISEYRYEDIIEAIDNILYKLNSIQLYYKISDKEIEEVMKYKVERQLKRIEENEKKN